MAWARCERCGVVSPVSCGDGSCTTDVLCDYCRFDDDNPPEQPAVKERHRERSHRHLP
jgi:hypothetical protein